MQIKEIIPKLWYWKKAAWTRPQWWCYDCMKPYLKYKDNDEYHAIKQLPYAENVIWMYWKQGEKNAPDIVRRCIASVRRHAGSYRVIVLDENTLNDYLVMPDLSSGNTGTENTGRRCIPTCCAYPYCWNTVGYGAMSLAL